VLLPSAAVSDERLSAYVTNTDRDVFALRNLPETYGREMDYVER
jgi:hypothetical protein